VAAGRQLHNTGGGLSRTKVAACAYWRPTHAGTLRRLGLAASVRVPPLKDA
jgi:hypothetical protein